MDKDTNENRHINKSKKELFKIMNNQTLKIVNDISLFKKYLDIQCKFEKYSVGNILLLQSQAPNTKQLNKEKQSLKDSVVYLLQPQKCKNQGFSIYSLFSSEREYKSNSLVSEKLLLKGFLNKCPVDIKVVDSLNDKNVDWNKEMNLLYIKKGSNFPDLFYGISRELTKEELGNDDSDLLRFKINCISYMILKRYNIDTSCIDINKIPKEFIKESPKEIRKELTELREGLTIFANRVDSFFYGLKKRNIKTDFKGR